MSDFKKCKKELLSKGRFYSSLTDRKTKGEEYEHVVNVWKWKNMKDCQGLYLKSVVLLLEMIA